jgi:hypothetical protein
MPLGDPLRPGSEYISDFTVAWQNSDGLHWTLVEVESPRARLYASRTWTLTLLCERPHSAPIRHRHLAEDHPEDLRAEFFEDVCRTAR